MVDAPQEITPKNANELLKIKEEMQETTFIKGFKLTNAYENILVFYQKNPFFYKNGNFWFWNNEEKRWEIKDEICLINELETLFEREGVIFTSRIKYQYVDCFKAIGTKKIPKEPPVEWIQFKDKVFDLKNQTIFEATPEYFFINPISWRLGESEETPTIDKLFKEWVGESKEEILYEIIAYCCYRSYPMHFAFVLDGSGRNGKTQFQVLLRKFLGANNVCSSDFDTLIESRFESAKLYKKLVCCIGETNFGIISKTSLFKRLTGGDLVNFEYKNKAPFDDFSYAKLIINTNSMPSSEDTSEGFYRRFMIVPFLNEFEEGKNIIEKIPEIEYENMAKKILKVIKKIIETGKITSQGSIEERKLAYLKASNPLSIFLEAHCIRDIEFEVTYARLYGAYCNYLLKKKKRIVTRKEFKSALELEGIFLEKIHFKNPRGEFYLQWGFRGLKFKDAFIDDLTLL